MPPTTASSDRLLFLDWARIGAFGLLVLFHVGMYYATWDWHIKSPHASAAIEPWMRLVSAWRLDLLFLISGAATSFMLRRHGAVGALLQVRASRLLWPLVFGMAVVVPPQPYFEVVQKYGYDGGFIAFMRLYFQGSRDFCSADGHCLILPTWNHLWFLPYLFAYTAVLWCLVRAAPAAPDALARRFDRLGAAGLLVAPMLWLLASLVLFGRFPVTHTLIDDWYSHAQYLGMFLLGATLAWTRHGWPCCEALRFWALIVALACWALLVTDLVPPPRATGAGLLLRAVVYASQQWFALVAVLGFAHRHLNRDHPVRRTLTEAVFPVYVLHQTLTILLARALAPARLAPMLEAGVLVAGTLALSFAGYLIVRRIGWLRPFFGLPPTARHARRVEAGPRAVR